MTHSTAASSAVFGREPDSSLLGRRATWTPCAPAGTALAASAQLQKMAPNPPTRPPTLQVPTMALEEWMEPRMYSSIAASLSTARAGGGAAALEDEACRVGPQRWRMKLAAPVDASCSSAACMARAQLAKAHPHKAHPPALPGSSWLQALHNALHNALHVRGLRTATRSSHLCCRGAASYSRCQTHCNQPALHKESHPAAANLRCRGTARR